MSSNIEIEVVSWVSVKNLAEAMTEGEMQHMANHLYKHYNIAPQKLAPKPPQGRRVNVDGVDYILVRDGE